MNADTGVAASFVPATLPFTLNVTRSGSGKVTSKPKGINCGKQCAYDFAAGSEVTLTATPAKKHQFLGWSGDCSGTAPTCTVPMTGDRNVSASFN
jgi:hypothetical protein